METAKLNELEYVYEATLKALTDFSARFDNNEPFFQEIIAASFSVYGSNSRESYKNFNEIRKLLAPQINHATKNAIQPKHCPVFRSYAPDGNAAVYVDELEYSQGPTKKFTIGISLTLFKMSQGWRVVQLHVSTSSNITEEKPVLNQESNLPKKTASEPDSNLQEALDQLKAIQAQLIRQEKLASLGKLAAGIAHEIKNPLNFVINFSDLSIELLEEAFLEVAAIEKPEIKQEIISILEDVKNNLEKINQHGTRADNIVKSMLKHSRGGSGKPELVKINDLIREYVNLSFHGMRAGKKPINVSIVFELNEKTGEVPLIQEDFSRVILNLCNNAFDAMYEKLQKVEDKNTYTPQLTVKTMPEAGFIIVEIQDNGPGIPQEIKNKILQPFFTTKKGNEGTGLGLSISQDIIKAHQGKLEIFSEEGNFSRFVIKLPGIK